MATRLDEGLEDFFSRRVMDESSRCGTSTHSHFHQAPRPWKDLCVCPALVVASPMTEPKASLPGIFPPHSHPSILALIAHILLGRMGPPQWNGRDGRGWGMAAGPGLGWPLG